MPGPQDREREQPRVKKHNPSAAERQAQALDKLFRDPSRPVRLPSPPREKTIREPPEMVKNVTGSSSGAGSGEFHVYKQARRNEYERVRIMEDKAQQCHAQTDFEKRKRLKELEDEEKTSKNRARRERKKLAAQRAKQQQKGDEEPSQKRRLVAPDAAAESITLRRADEPGT